MSTVLTTFFGARLLLEFIRQVHSVGFAPVGLYFLQELRGNVGGQARAGLFVNHGLVSEEV